MVGLFSRPGSDDDKLLYISDYYSPCGSKSNPKTIPLYPMGQQLDPPPAQLFGITNVAMTCSPDQSNDFAVAVNCLGPLINFFRPGGKHKDSGSVHFTTPLQHFNQSKVMYSKRDEKFYTTSVDGRFLVYYDAFFEEDMTIRRYTRYVTFMIVYIESYVLGSFC
ncbi:hypothetical protein Rs2_10004 [Raphanus sativus]|nr:hypothetical protein Rs2_10004 [Raphanus sativus]